MAARPSTLLPSYLSPSVLESHDHGGTSPLSPSTPPSSDLTPPSAPGSEPLPVLARDPVAASERETTTTMQIEQLRDRADALHSELDAVADATEAAKMATRDAERRAWEAAAELRRLVVARSSRMMQAERKLRELGEELREKDARIKLLEAIVPTQHTPLRCRLLPRTPTMEQLD